MRRWQQELICSRCGKKFTKPFEDTVKYKDLIMLTDPLCGKCRIIERLTGQNISEH